MDKINSIHDLPSWCNSKNYNYLKKISQKELIKLIEQYSIAVELITNKNSYSDIRIIEMLSSFLSNREAKVDNQEMEIFFSTLMSDFHNIFANIHTLDINLSTKSGLDLLGFCSIEYTSEVFQKILSKPEIESLIESKVNNLMSNASEFTKKYKNTKGELGGFYGIARLIETNSTEAKDRILNSINNVKLFEFYRFHTNDFDENKFDSFNRPILQIDVKNNTDDVLIDNFRDFLASYRKEINIPEPETNKPREGDLEKVIQYKTFTVIDLWIYQVVNNVKISQEIICEAVFDDENKTTDFYRKRVIPLITKVFNNEFLSHYV